MIVDTSALVAILYQEGDAETFVRAINAAPVCRLSVVNLVELSMVIEAQLGAEGAQQLDALVRRADVVIEPVTLEHGVLARQAFRDFGKGRHPAKLNFGDCFAYALARACGESLLFKGQDFALTDITSAL